ncbi:hypothetical protein ACU4GD_03780 [Cupriavidus basilensis]
MRAPGRQARTPAAPPGPGGRADRRAGGGWRGLSSIDAASGGHTMVLRSPGPEVPDYWALGGDGARSA